MKYFDTLNKQTNNQVIIDAYEYAIKNNVPIITDDGLLCLLNIIKLSKSKSILEVGTAIAYCAMHMADLSDDMHIDTIERKKDMYNIALENVRKANMENKINLIFGDALDVEIDKDVKYDLIFIDAAKSQYIKFFEKYEKHLNPNGIIVSDNLLFHGLIEHETAEVGKDLRAMLRKIRNYNDWLKNNDKYDTTFLRIGDGMAISIKK